MRIKETINSKGHVRVTYELRNDSDLAQWRNIRDDLVRKLYTL